MLLLLGWTSTCWCKAAVKKAASKSVLIYVQDWCHWSFSFPLKECLSRLEKLYLAWSPSSSLTGRTIQFDFHTPNFGGFCLPRSLQDRGLKLPIQPIIFLSFFPQGLVSLDSKKKFSGHKLPCHWPSGHTAQCFPDRPSVFHGYSSWSL